MKLPIKVLVNCDSCDCALSYSQQPDRTFILRHPDNGCVRSRETYKGPMLELEAIDAST
jgi:hypothetical protein